MSKRAREHLAEQIIMAWHETKGPHVPLIDYMHLSNEEYNMYVMENKLPSDFLERHGQE